MKKTVTLAIILLTMVIGAAIIRTKQANAPIIPDPIPTGTNILGVFGGRVPCGETIREINNITNPDCDRVKMQVILYQEPKTKAPTNFELIMVHVGTGDESFVKTGKWKITKSAKGEIYQLMSDDSKVISSLFKVDSNVLMPVDKDMNILVGTESWGYQLSRLTN